MKSLFVILFLWSFIFISYADSKSSSEERISIMSDDYTFFLQQRAVTDLEHLYDRTIGETRGACIQRLGEPGNYYYQTEKENLPISMISLSQVIQYWDWKNDQDPSFYYQLETSNSEAIDPLLLTNDLQCYLVRHSVIALQMSSPGNDRSLYTMIADGKEGEGLLVGITGLFSTLFGGESSTTPARRTPYPEIHQQRTRQPHPSREMKSHPSSATQSYADNSHLLLKPTPKSPPEAPVPSDISQSSHHPRVHRKKSNEEKEKTFSNTTFPSPIMKQSSPSSAEDTKKKLPAQKRVSFSTEEPQQPLQPQPSQHLTTAPSDSQASQAFLRKKAFGDDNLSSMHKNYGTF